MDLKDLQILSIGYVPWIQRVATSCLHKPRLCSIITKCASRKERGKISAVKKRKKVIKICISKLKCDQVEIENHVYELLGCQCAKPVESLLDCRGLTQTKMHVILY
jgi:hypothetical protein